MIKLDAGVVGGSGSYLRTALVLAAILQKPITINDFALEKMFQGLSGDKIVLIRALATATGATITGVEPGSTSITFIPTHPWSQKKVSLGLQGSVSLALQGLLLPALFSRGKVKFHLTGRTHARNAPTITYMQHVFFRYLSSLVDDLHMKENAFGFSPRGDVEVTVKGRVNRLPPLAVSGGEELAGIRLELVASKNYLTSESLARLETLAKLMYPKIRVATRYMNAEERGVAAGMFAFFGNEHGFDNDKPFVIGKDAVWVGDLEQDNLEKKFSLFVKDFLGMLREPAIDEFCADQLIVLLALVGGEIKVQRVTNKVKANIAAAEAISGTLFEIDGDIIRATPHIEEL